MPEAIADAGPILHLHEIEQVRCLSIFDRLLIPDLVEQELRDLQLDPAQLGITVTTLNVPKAEWNSVINETHKPIIHPADAQIFILARSREFREPVLTDDLALRKRLENEGATVVGTVGILVRAYSTERLRRGELERAVDNLFTASTLHMSRAFKEYVRHLLADLS